MSDFPLRAALDAAEPKPSPTGAQGEKKNYAQRLSNALAQTVADALRPEFPAVTPAADGTGQESAVGVARGTKRLDVKVTDQTLGLLLSVSIKTYSFQDYSPSKNRLGRWTKNIVRNDHELRGEAMVLHQRQPYSVLIAVMFEPSAIADDGDPANRSDKGKSSFAHHVTTLAKRVGRGKRPVLGGAPGAWVDLGAEDSRYDLFERVFIGLYEPDGEQRGAVRFFDVENAPPRNGPPSANATISFDEFVTAIKDEVTRRNRSAPSWADPDADVDPAAVDSDASDTEDLEG
ncbi:hypothetical protein [Blastococcus capsensis]|uniref:hypothetical protein n=1 Tax=Blastococcus capsensis TaxID=1564163 RepID=UPI0025413B35|nr:hypothetical protein [Blastococcus capsensis]MDK3255264.1 hypothetical protein [Blastococcus capsensis]